MSGSTSILSTKPGFTPGTFDGQMVRLATLGNASPGIYAAGDFTISQRAAGANLSVDAGAGRAFVDPQTQPQQGVYLALLKAADAPFNTLATGGYTWTASDATNPRIDLVCLEVQDTDFGGLYTGTKFRIVDGTPNAAATSATASAYWPAVPAGCVLLAAVHRPAASTTILTANISNVASVGGRARRVIVTSLPAAPYDGQEIYLQTAAMLTAGTPPWCFRYNATWTTNAYKWESIGFNAATSHVEATETVNNSAYSDAATVGPVVALPAPGLYAYDFTVGWAGNSAAGQVILAAVDIPGVTIGDGAQSGRHQAYAASASGMINRNVPPTFVATTAGNATLKYRSGGSMSLFARTLTARPVRIG